MPPAAERPCAGSESSSRLGRCESLGARDSRRVGTRTRADETPEADQHPRCRTRADATESVTWGSASRPRGRGACSGRPGLGIYIFGRVFNRIELVAFSFASRSSSPRCCTRCRCCCARPAGPEVALGALALLHRGRGAGRHRLVRRLADHVTLQRARRPGPTSSTTGPQLAAAPAAAPEVSRPRQAHHQHHQRDQVAPGPADQRRRPTVRTVAEVLGAC